MNGTGALREMRTLCESLDHILRGRVTEACDFLVQRLLARELASMEGSWQSARHLELIPLDNASSVGEESTQAPAKVEAARQKLEVLLAKNRDKSEDEEMYREGEAEGIQGLWEKVKEREAKPCRTGS